MAVRCYIEEYESDRGGMGVRLREKETGRKVEIIAFSQSERDAVLQFLLAPRLTGAADDLPNLYQQHGDDDFVVVDGTVGHDTSDLIQFIFDSQLSYLIR